MRLAATALAYLVSFVLVAAGAFITVMLLAGPHGGVLPASLHSATLLLGWACVLVVPLLVARWVWRRSGPAQL
jgi:ABC-type uncharacterized transport system permease subunit